MEYTVKRLSSLAGVSPRTLRYYDEIGIKPVELTHQAIEFTVQEK